MYTPASVFCSGVERFAAPTDTLELAGYRTALGLPTKTFADFPNERRTLYSSVADVDLYVGLMLEAYRVGGVSQTAAALAFGQFQKLLTEDRQGYRNQFGNGFPVTAQLKALLVGDGGGSYGGMAVLRRQAIPGPAARRQHRWPLRPRVRVARPCLFQRPVTLCFSLKNAS